jgi:tRNA-modifying protein YgfZ
MSEPAAICLLDDLGTLQFKGPDAQKFLQGQLSNDVARLTPGSMLRAGLHNAQGRTLALLWLIGRSQEDILALLPRELLSPIATQLRRYLLRAKLTLSDVSEQFRIHGVCGDKGAQPPPDGVLYDPGRALLIQPALQAAPSGKPMSREQWRALDIAAGVPQVYAATSAQFVAQMLNLDCVDAVSFSKGCYTGQEVIARAHYRGRVKRRMQRFESATALSLAPGDSGRLEDGRAFRVIDSVLREDGWREFLAVAPLPGMAREWEEPGAADGAPSLRADALELPYRLPG